jgi:hypothetical protein
VVSFIYFHFLGDRNLFPPPRIGDAPSALILPAAGEHLHELLSERLFGRSSKGSSASPDLSAPDFPATGRQHSIDLAASKTAHGDGLKR